jgi:hypothetical protein
LAPPALGFIRGWARRSCVPFDGPTSISNDLRPQIYQGSFHMQNWLNTTRRLSSLKGNKNTLLYLHMNKVLLYGHQGMFVLAHILTCCNVYRVLLQASRQKVWYRLFFGVTTMVPPVLKHSSQFTFFPTLIIRLIQKIMLISILFAKYFFICRYFKLNLFFYIFAIFFE